MKLWDGRSSGNNHRATSELNMSVFDDSNIDVQERFPTWPLNLNVLRALESDSRLFNESPRVRCEVKVWKVPSPLTEWVHSGGGEEADDQTGAGNQATSQIFNGQLLSA